MWDYRFGGSGFDCLTTLQQTKDGGYFLGGWSNSGIGGDKSQNTIGDLDYWIVKLDSAGSKLWDKNFGATDEERLSSAFETADGGFIIGGYSRSGIGGDKTQASWDTSADWNFLKDYWILKLDSLGNKQWDKTLGGMYIDELSSIVQTREGGYLLGGGSASDINGDKTQSTRGEMDYWIIKIDSAGNKQWDKDYGGTERDYLSCMVQTSDGGFILGGSSKSGIGGDKTRPGYGDIDYWIIKTDSLGNKQWDACFGGTAYDALRSLKQTADKGYILGGFSLSGISGNKSTPLVGGIMHDYWIIKTDSLGNFEWEKDFGGSDIDYDIGSISVTNDGGYLISGSSNSNISGDKTENSSGSPLTWVLKTDSLGNKLWDKTVFTAVGTALYQGELSIQTMDGCYVFGNSEIGGIGGYKTQGGRGNFDYWIIKFCESLQANFTATTNLCPGSCTSFLNLTTIATAYQWSFSGGMPSTSTDVSPQNICYAAPGSYDVQLIATNANGSDTLLLQITLPFIRLLRHNQSHKTEIHFLQLQGQRTYQWYFNGNIISGATDYFYVAPVSGDYNVVATDGEWL